MMWRNGTMLIAAACLAASSGCLCHGICTKAESERQCPTDIRKTHYWCFGEDAIMHCPCGPKNELYGYERTQWRAWPDYCEDCGVPGPRSIPEQPRRPVAPMRGQPSRPAGTNPFRHDRPT